MTKQGKQISLSSIIHTILILKVASKARKREKEMLPQHLKQKGKICAYKVQLMDINYRTLYSHMKYSMIGDLYSEAAVHLQQCNPMHFLINHNHAAYDSSCISKAIACTPDSQMGVHYCSQEKSVNIYRKQHANKERTRCPLTAT